VGAICDDAANRRSLHRGVIQSLERRHSVCEGSTTLRRTLYLFLLGLLVATCLNSEASAAPPTQRAVRLASGSLLGPSGGLIALTLRDQYGKLQIFTITPDGTNRKQLTFERDNGRSDWSPDGKRIAFASKTTMTNARPWVAVMDADGSNQKLLVEGDAPDWSPDGTQIAFSSPDGQIWVMNTDGSMVRRITQSNTAKFGPSWSPDGQEMAFILIKNPGSPTDFQPEIGIMSSDGTNERILTTEDRINANGSGTVCETANDANAPAWSPVDNRIAFWSGIEGQYGQIWVINSDGTGSKQLTEDCSHRNSDDPSWSPDGKRILFSTGRSGRNELWVMDADGSMEARISEIDAFPFPGRATWQPTKVPRRRAARRSASGTLLGPSRPVRVSPVPDRAAIVYHRQGFFFVMDENGANESQITFDEPRTWEHVALSFDRRFAVANEQLPNPSGEPGGFSRLWIFDLQAATVAQLVPGFVTAGNGGVDWDGDGFIYFAAKQTNPVSNPRTPEDFRANAGANDIYRIRYDGTGLQRLLNTPMAGEADVSISEDGSLIAYVAQPLDVSPARTEIWVMRADGTNHRLVFAAGEVRLASAHDPETSPDNLKIVFSIVNSEVPPNFPQNPDANTAHDIWQMNLDGSGATRLTRPGPISIAPDWKGDSILYLDISESDRYAGLSLVRPDESGQAPQRIRPDANIAKWIPGTTDFSNPERVTIRGYFSDAMEPFLTRDGRYLLFNNSNAPGTDTNLHYAERVDDLTFDYRGEISGANTAALDAVPTLDAMGNIYFVSTRSYSQTLSTIYRGRFESGIVTEVELVPGISKGIPGAINFDVEVSADGGTLYFVDGVFSGGPVPQSADLFMAVRDGARFNRLSPDLLAGINTAALEYAACISADQRELFFTRVDRGDPAIYRSTRNDPAQPWSLPTLVQAITGFVEAPTLSSDGRSLYYHALRDSRFVIERVTRP